MNIIFVDTDPAGCTRGCRKFYESKIEALAFALYAPPDVSCDSEPTICIHAFSCGAEIKTKLRINPANIMKETVMDAIKKVLPLFHQEALQERRDYEISLQ